MTNLPSPCAAFLVACSILFALAVPALAAAKKPALPPPDMRKMIESVDMNTRAVVIIYMHGKQLHTYRIDDLTVLTINGVLGKLADIKSGMEVTSYLERDNDELDGLTLSGQGGPIVSKDPAPKKSRRRRRA
jgi:hypothetical protein